MRTLVFGDLYWGTPILGNYQIYFGFLEGSMGCWQLWGLGCHIQIGGTHWSDSGYIGGILGLYRRHIGVILG